MMSQAVSIAVRDTVAVITVDSPPLNTLSHAVRAGLMVTLSSALADESVGSIILACAGRTFFPGADLTEFAAGPKPPLLRDVLQAFEDSPKAVVAAIHGTALGGGLELALVCHGRVAARSARLGLPEVLIGLIPGAGGSQRLPRLVGVEAALDLVTSGRQVSASEAHAIGLVDALAEDGAANQPMIAAAMSLASELASRDVLPKIRDRDERLAPARSDPGIFDRFRADNARLFRGFVAPGQAIRAIEAAVALPFDDGLREERRLIEELLTGQQSRALRHAFFSERAVARVPGLPADTVAVPVTRVGVVGAGTMGGGIAMAMLDGGLNVTLVESDAGALERGLTTIRRNYATSVTRGRLTATAVDERLARLTPTLRLDDLGAAELIVEAVFEQMDIKTALFARLDAIARPDMILASNTSYLDLDAIAAATTRPERVVGLHFFSPANVMRLLEIVRGAHTEPAVIATALALAKRIGKIGVVVGNGWGFVGNRMLAQRQREAEALILEGALAQDVDRVLTEFGFPMGPFQMRDLAGNDVGWTAAGSTSSTVREILNERGRFGQKVGRGYYDYAEGSRTPVPSAEVETTILELAARRGIPRRAIDDEEIRTRTLYPMVNEGARILAEGKAARASDIDVVWLAGYGWPRYTGGPMFWAGQEGLPAIVESLGRFQAAHGDQFSVAPLLARLAAEERSFEDMR